MKDESSRKPDQSPPPAKTGSSQGRNPQQPRGGRRRPAKGAAPKSPSPYRAKKAGPRQPTAAGQGGSPAKPGKPASPKRPPGALELKWLGGNQFAFQPPDCAIDRDLDLEEAIEIRAAGEFEIARDELLYLVGDCRGFLEAYLQLAELALEDEDISLAKGHFGFAYETGLEALPPNFRGQLPCTAGYNAHFYAAGRGLARCLISRHEPGKAREVLEQLLRFDPAEDNTRSLLEQLNERDQSASSGDTSR